MKDFYLQNQSGLLKKKIRFFIFNRLSLIFLGFSGVLAFSDHKSSDQKISARQFNDKKLTAQQQNPGPFFWQIQKEGKSAYVLGTMHVGVDFEELQCHEEIKDHLVSADFLLTEVPKGVDYLYGLDILIDQRRTQNTENQNLFDELSPSARDFFDRTVKAFEQRYYTKLQEYPPPEFYDQFYKQLNQFSYFRLQHFIYDMCYYAFYPFLSFIDVPLDFDWQSPIFPESVSDLPSTQSNSLQTQSNQNNDFISIDDNNDLDIQVLDIFLNAKKKSLNIDQNIELKNQFLYPSVYYEEPIEDMDYYGESNEDLGYYGESNEDLAYYGDSTEDMDLSLEESIADIEKDRRIAKNIYNKKEKLIDQILYSGEDLKNLTNEIANFREVLVILIDLLPNPLADKQNTVDQFVAPIDDFTLDTLHSFFMVSITQKEDIEEWAKNFEQRCSKDTLAKINEHEENFIDYVIGPRKDHFINGIPISPEQEYQYLWGDPDIGFLDTEIKQEKILTNKYSLDFRNEMLRQKILKAYEQHESLFIAAGSWHFNIETRDHFNFKALQEYAEANKALPTNVLDMLKEEGFTVKRMQSDCTF